MLRAVFRVDCGRAVLMRDLSGAERGGPWDRLVAEVCLCLMLGLCCLRLLSLVSVAILLGPGLGAVERLRRDLLVSYLEACQLIGSRKGTSWGVNKSVLSDLQASIYVLCADSLRSRRSREAAYCSTQFSMLGDEMSRFQL